jgi:hypothetical protein
MGNEILNSIMHTLTGHVWEVRQTIVVEPFIATDPQDITTIKVKLAGMFSYYDPETHRLPGMTEDTDAVFASAERIDMSSQILHDDVLFEIISESSADGYAMTCWTYGLKLTGSTEFKEDEFMPEPDTQPN